MSSITINGNLENDGSITLSGNTGAKEYEVYVPMLRREQHVSYATAIVNVSADSAESAMEWIEQNPEEIYHSLEDTVNLEWEIDDDGPSDTWDPEICDARVNGLIMRQNIKVRVVMEKENE